MKSSTQQRAPIETHLCYRLPWLSHDEQYGAHVVEKFLGLSGEYGSVLDIGAGQGRDLGIAKKVRPAAQCRAIECYPPYVERLEQAGVTCFPCDIEREALPFEDASTDVVMANQVLEHVKEIFWICHEMARILSVGGYAILGVPNVASLHNRIRLLWGQHPSQAKTCSAHVRVYSKNDFMLYLNTVFPGGFALQDFAGSQFPPLPRAASRVLSKLFPQCAFSIFFLLRKTRPYNGEFLSYLQDVVLETNYYRGPSA